MAHMAKKLVNSMGWERSQEEERRENMAQMEKEKRVISFDEFKELVNSEGWERSQEVEIVDRFLIERWNPELAGWVDVPRVIGWGTKFNKLDDVEIIYVESWSCDEGDSDSFASSAEDWIVDGVRVVYDDGDEVTTSDLADVLPKEFITIDYSELEI